jgi:hypothetical protein
MRYPRPLPSRFAARPDRPTDGVIVVPVDNHYLRANAFSRIDAPFGREVVKRIRVSQHIEGPQVQPRGIILYA